MTREEALDGMKAYVWVQGIHDGGVGVGKTMRLTLRERYRLAGFETIYDVSPTANRIYEVISDPMVKCYTGIGHGSDSSAQTGNGRIYAINFEDRIRKRGSPLTIGIAIHCGTPWAYTPSRWLNAMTLGHPDVVGEIFFGVGWAKPLKGLTSKESWCSATIILHRIRGKTYYEASELAYENTNITSGLNQGNKDLKLPQFYDGYPKGWFVNPVIFYSDEDGKITRAAAVSAVNDFFKHQISLTDVMKVIRAYFG